MYASAILPDVETVKTRLKHIWAEDWFTERGALCVSRSRVRHFLSWVHQLFMQVNYRTFEGKASRQTQRGTLF
jgi:hypothetical protein